MNFSNDNLLMKMPLESVGLSGEFTRKAIQHGYHTLDEITGIPLTDLLKMEWFTPEMFDELCKVIRTQGKFY